MFKGGNGVSRAALVIRLLIGGYLLYIDYQIFPDVMARQGISRVIMLAIMGLFAIAGITLIIMSGKSLMTGDYDQGETDKDDPEDIVTDGNEIIDVADVTSEEPDEESGADTAGTENEEDQE